MTHAGWEARLSPYLDSELPAGEAREVQRHLDGCAGCRARIEQMRRISESIHGLDRIPMPADLKAALSPEARRVDLASNAGRPAARRLFIARPWALASLGAAALVVVVIALVPMRLHREAAPPEAVVAPSQDRTVESVQRSADFASAPPARELPEKQEPLPSPAGAPRKARETEIRRTLAARPAAEPDQAPQPPAVIDDAEAMISRAEAPAPSSGIAGENLTPPDQPARNHIVARFATELIWSEQGSASLAPIVPAEPPALKGAPESVTGTTLTATAGKAVAAHAAGREAPMSSLVFLLSLDAGGRIVSADLEGARTVDVRTVELTRALLLAASITPHGPADPSLVVIEVKLPEAP